MRFLKGIYQYDERIGIECFCDGARIRFDPDLLLENMKTLIKTAGTNFLIIDGHHCTEKTAVIETVNSMMLQTVEVSSIFFHVGHKHRLRLRGLEQKEPFSFLPIMTERQWAV